LSSGKNRTARADMLAATLVTGLLAPAPTRISPADVDPIIGRLLRSSSYSAAASSASIADLTTSATGLQCWRRALMAGRVPDFEGVDNNSPPWPPEPLCGQLSDAMCRLGLPRTTSRHPSLVPAALAAVLAASARFGDQVDRMASAAASTEVEVDEEEDGEEQSYLFDEEEVKEEAEAVEEEEAPTLGMIGRGVSGARSWCYCSSCCVTAARC